MQVLLGTTVAVPPVPIPTSVPCTNQTTAILTFYGFPNNSPPGAAIAFKCSSRGYTAGGIGTYDDPLTMSTAAGAFTKCEIVYIPYMRKYVRYEDECPQCSSDWKKGKTHISVWTGSHQVTGGQEQLDCEDSLTPDYAPTVVQNPPSELEVDQTMLYQKEGRPACAADHVYRDLGKTFSC
ncbi:MAG: hypothetical protein M1814_005087 [Vezdaea aestivalis]|nr:MAG: hypothetical protein M1814_005087 [Vezdaea aestivalis]